MATFGQLCDRTRRLMSEATADYFSLTVLEEHVNTAYWLAIRRVREVAPDEFLTCATTDIVNAQQRYSRPNFENIRRYEILQGGVYVELPYLLEEQAVGKIGDVSSLARGEERRLPAYTIQGDYLWLWPTPTASVTAGLRVVYEDVVTMTTSLTEPKLPKALRHVLAYGAAVFGLEESKDAAEAVVDRYRRRWEGLMGAGSGSTAQSREALKVFFQTPYSRPMLGRNLGG